MSVLGKQVYNPLTICDCNLQLESYDALTCREIG